MLPELLDLHVRLGVDYGLVPVLPRGIRWAPERESYAAAGITPIGYREIQGLWREALSMKPQP